MDLRRGSTRVAMALTVTLALAVVIAAAVISLRPQPPDLPGSMAAMGDSITQATLVSVAAPSPSNPQHSWATGDADDDPVVSHYERLLAADDAITGHVYNESVPGAVMADAPAQAARVVDRDVEYVTLLMGANDVCGGGAATMTPVAAFAAAYDEALQRLSTGLPRARILVVSVPDVTRLWALFAGEPRARQIWQAFGICPSVLSAQRTATDRRAARDRIVSFNRVLRDGCARHPRCRFDRGAVFEEPFTREDVSPLDFFHPSLAGQARLAERTWAAGYWPEVGP